MGGHTSPDRRKERVGVHRSSSKCREQKGFCAEDLLGDLECGQEGWGRAGDGGQKLKEAGEAWKQEYLGESV